MKVAAFFVALLAVQAFASLPEFTLDPKGEFAPPSIPAWPAVYTLDLHFRVPYFSTDVQVRVSNDATTKAQQVSYYNGLDTELFRWDLGKSFNTYPRINTRQCQTSSLSSSDAAYEWLPNLQDTQTWQYIGYTHNHNDYIFKQTNKVQNFTNEYWFSVSSHDFRPVQLIMRGFDYILGSHPDQYIVDYLRWDPNHVDETIFTPPALCKGARENQNNLHRSKAFHQFLGMSRMGQPAASPSAFSDKFIGFMKQHGKKYATIEEFHRRREIFETNVKYINAHNARGDSTYTLGITRFADMELEEMQRVMIPHKFSQDKLQRPDAYAAHIAGAKVAINTQQLPTSVDWFAQGKVNPPKDQGACGSCYTFGSAGALESAWAIKTGRLVSISEQQMIDCAWVPNGDSGCGGGYAEQVFQWIIDNKGVALEQSYHYLMMDGFCRPHVKNSGVVVQSYTNVTATEAGLQAAVAKGPVAVAIDASLQDFYFYTGGIYSNPACNPNDRDHEVLVIGYGTQANQDFWLLKNSWGDIWGEKGFFRFKRNTGTPGGQCGVAVEGRQPNV